MFCGIVEEMAQLLKIEQDRQNKHFYLTCSFVDQLKIDQSVSHNGVCLTVVGFETINNQPAYKVTAMLETLERSNLALIQVNDWVNVERSMKVDALLDGHIVQGHVDNRAKCVEFVEKDGSWQYTFEYDCSKEDIDRGYFCVDKGSVAINGVSLTACEPQIIGQKGYVRVYIIPYTFDNTNFKYIRPGSVVNIEFDIIGKYIAKYSKLYVK